MYSFAGMRCPASPEYRVQFPRNRVYSFIRNFHHVRGFLNGVPDKMTTMIHRDLDHIRNELSKRGLINFGPGENNHPVVLEIWVGTDENLGTIV